MAAISNYVNKGALNKNENILLCWYNHNYLLSNLVKELYTAEILFDCTLWVNGATFDCHRIVLSACSPFLNNIIKDHPANQPLIMMEGMNKVEIEAIIQFIYTGQTTVPNEILGTFLETCKFLEITGLKDYTLINQITDEKLELDESEPIVTIPTGKFLSSVDIEPKNLLEEDLTNISSHFILEESSASDDVLTGVHIQSASIPGNDDEIIVQLLGDSSDNADIKDDPMWENSKQSSPAKEKRYRCVKCGNRYAHRRTLLHHLHWICNQPATYACTFCPYMGKRKYQLKSHLKHVHQDALSKQESLDS